jgi:hypothetical protein
MKNFKLLNLLLEIDETTDCEAGTKVTISQTEYANMADSANYHYFKDTRSNYFKCKKKGSKPKEKEEEKPVVAGKCPSDDGYGNKYFQEWVWKTHLGKTETDTVTTKLCGLKNGKAKTCAYSIGVDGNCQDGTKAVWLELRDKFIEFKNGSQPVVNVDPEVKKRECLDKGMDYDETTKNCVPKPIVVDPDVQELVEDMGRYRTILNGFYDTSWWISLDSLAPNQYTPNFLSIDLLTAVTTQITELIKQKGSSSDFGNFVKMMKALKNAYNNDKFKGMFQKKVDPDGTDVFTTIDTLITNITTEANKIKGSLGYDPLVSPTEKQIRDFVFRGQLRSVYKSGRLNLMMMVYTYTDTEPLKTNNKESVSEITSFYNEVTKNRNFDNCKNILGVYRETYQENDVYDQPLLTKVTSEIQKCWCDKQYEDLGKLGVKNMFDKQMRQDRKDLIAFLNQLPSASMGDFAVRLNSGVCTKNKSYR